VFAREGQRTLCSVGHVSESSEVAGIVVSEYTISGGAFGSMLAFWDGAGGLKDDALGFMLVAVLGNDGAAS
jgi:hypothetical protein